MLSKPLQENANSLIRCNFELETNVTDVSAVSFVKLNPHKHSTEDSRTKEELCPKYRINDLPEISAIHGSLALKARGPGQKRSESRDRPINAEPEIE
jgi:hypothetical protein